MRPISTRELRWLLGRHTPPCVSVYLPASRGADPGADRARFEARVSEASRLLRGGLDAADADRLLAPLYELTAAKFWSSRTDALAAFRSRDVFTHYRIAATVPELTVVADTFHTRPLVRYLNSSRRHYYVLALSGGGVELLEGSPDRLAPVGRDELPPELADALADPRGPALLGGAKSDRGDELARWFRAVDRAVWGWLREDDLPPLILAGMPQHHAAYQSASRYPELLDETIGRDLGGVDRAELHRAALELIRQHEADVLGAILARVSSALAAGAADADLRAVARAAVQGRVAMLVFTASAQQWGRLDRRSGELALEDRQRDEVDADVIDDLCEVVLLSGGDVHEVPAGALPGPIVAVYRT